PHVGIIENESPTAIGLPPHNLGCFAGNLQGLVVGTGHAALPVVVDDCQVIAYGHDPGHPHLDSGLHGRQHSDVASDRVMAHEGAGILSDERRARFVERHDTFHIARVNSLPEQTIDIFWFLGGHSVGASYHSRPRPWKETDSW